MQNDCLLKRVEKQKLTARAFGFYWKNLHQLIDQVRSECVEVEDAWGKDKSHLQEEVGDLMEAAISLAIFCDFDPRETLLKTFEKFEKRYQAVVKLAQSEGHIDLKEQSYDVLLDYWNRVKNSSGTH